MSQRKLLGGLNSSTLYINEVEKLPHPVKLSRRERRAINAKRCLRDEKRGRSYGLVFCHSCQWGGTEDQLVRVWDVKHAYKNLDKWELSRPAGYCPRCGERAYWRELSKGQEAIMAP